MPLPPAPIDSFRRWSADKWARTTGALVDTLSDHGWDLGAEERISQLGAPIAQPLPEPEPLPAPEPPPLEAQIPPSPLPAPEPEPYTPPAPSWGERLGGAFSGLGTRAQGALQGAQQALSGAGQAVSQQVAAEGQAAGDWVDQAQSRISDLGGTLGDLNQQATGALDTAASDYLSWRDSGGPRPSLGDALGGLVSGFLPDREAIGANLGRQLAGQPLAFDAASQAAGASFREPLQRATAAVEEPFIGFAQSMGSPDYPRLDREQGRRLVESTTEQLGGLIDPAAGLQTAAPEGLDLARRAAPEAGEAAPGLFRGLGERVRELPYRFGRALEEEYGPALGVVPRRIAETTPGPVRLPELPDDLDLIANTRGIDVTPDGVVAQVRRYQKPGQALTPVTREGVYYSPIGQGAGYRKIGDFAGEGGSQGITGTTLYKRPLVVSEFGEGTGMGASVIAKVLPDGPARATEMGEAARDVFRTPWDTAYRMREFLQGYGGYDGEAAAALARDIQDNVPSGFSQRYALMDAVGAKLARDSGFDGVLYARGPKIEEVIDLREATYPGPRGRYTLRPEYEPGAAGPESRSMAAADRGAAIGQTRTELQAATDRLAQLREDFGSVEFTAPDPRWAEGVTARQDFPQVKASIRELEDRLRQLNATPSLGIAQGGGVDGGGFDLGTALRQGASPFMARAAQTTGERAFDIGSGVAGGVAGAATAPEEATWQERTERGLAGAALGALGGAHLRQLGRVTGRALGPELAGAAAGRRALGLAEGGAEALAGTGAKRLPAFARLTPDDLYEIGGGVWLYPDGSLRVGDLGSHPDDALAAGFTQAELMARGPARIGRSVDDGHLFLEASSPLTQEQRVAVSQLVRGSEEGFVYDLQGRTGNRLGDFLRDAAASRALDRRGGMMGIVPGGEGIPPIPGTARRFIGKSPLERLPEANVPEGAGEIRLSPAKEGERLRLDQFPEWAREPIRKGAEEANWFREQRRGVIPDDLAASMADDAQKSVQDWIKNGRAGKVLNTEETRALANAIAGQAKVVSDLSAQADAAKQAGGVTDRMVTELFTEGEKLQALTAIREGGRAEWGRAGRAWQAAAKAIDLPPSEAAARIFSKVGGRDRAQELLSQYQGLLDSGATPTQLARFWSQVEHGPVKAGDWLHLLRYNAMLSGVPTMMVNMLGSATELGQKGAMDVASSLARGQARELAPEARGAFVGMGVGARRFMQTMREGITSEEALAGGLPRSVSARVTNPAARRIATTLEVPGRLQGATDEFMTSLAYGMSAGRRAAQRATEGGLTGDAWRQEVARLMDDLPSDLSKRAQADADRLTFRNALPEKGLSAGIGKARGVVPGGTFLIPFYKTVANITSRGIERSPLGALGTTFDVLRRQFPNTPFGAGPYEQALNDSLKIKEGVTPLGERVANNVLGSAAFGYFASQAMAGNISAEGPRDTREREVLRAQGWQPYSVKLGDRWLSYSNLGPWAIPLALAGSVGEAERYGQAGEQWYEHMDDVVRGTGALLADQPYMAGIGAIYKAFDDPERYGTQWLSQTLGSLIPFGGALNTVASATDPYQRQATAEGGPVAQALGQVATRVPGLRQGQPVARDVFGNPVRNPRSEVAGLGALNPVRFAPTPARETRELRRFVGARSAAEDARIAAAIRHVEDFDAGRTGVPPRREELRLYDQFAGAENPEYTEALRGGRELSRTERVERERRASGAPAGP